MRRVRHPYLSNASPSARDVAMDEPGCEIKYRLPATGSGLMRQSCSWPQTTRLMLSSKRPSGTDSCGPCLTLRTLESNHLNDLKSPHRFWCKSSKLNQSVLSFGINNRTRLLLSSKCILASLTFPTPYKPRCVLPLRRSTGRRAIPSAGTSLRGSSTFPM